MPGTAAVSAVVLASSVESWPGLPAGEGSADELASFGAGLSLVWACRFLGLPNVFTGVSGPLLALEGRFLSFRTAFMGVAVPALLGRTPALAFALGLLAPLAMDLPLAFARGGIWASCFTENLVSLHQHV